jgi:hypothetical protein
MDPLKYNCESCCFHTPYKTRYDSHVLTKRHINKNNNETKQEYQYICQKCKKTFKSSSGLWSHKTKCNNPKKVEILDVSMKDTIINEMHNIMKINPPQTIIQNQQNNSFNVNLFLNENLTQAKNFVDMIQNISVKRPYPEEISSENYVQCVVDMITTEMNKIPIDERPIHCIKDEDENQKILHIRHQNKWEKEIELDWTSQIHNGYFETHEENKDETIIFTGIKKLEDNIISEIEKLNDLRKRSQYSSERGHPPNKVLIIKCLLDYANIDKDNLLQIIDQAYLIKPNHIQN